MPIGEKAPTKVDPEDTKHAIVKKRGSYSFLYLLIKYFIRSDRDLLAPVELLDHASERRNEDIKRAILKEGETAPLYASLIRYVPKSGRALLALVALLDHAPYEQRNIKSLYTAIKTGGASAEIFSHVNSFIYFLHLLKDKRLSHAEGITALIYFTALAQFTDKQPLKPADGAVKRISEVEVISIDNPAYRETVAQYLTQLVESFVKINSTYKIDIEALMAFMATVTPIEKWLIAINVTPSFSSGPSRRNDINHFTWLMLTFSPYLQLIKEANIYLIPSYSLLRYLLQVINPERQMQAVPMLGIVGENTLRKFHERGQHPVAIYSPLVSKNLTNVDGYQPGPLLVMIHDFLHTFMGTLFTPKQYRFIYQILLPLLDEIADEHKDNPMLSKKAT
jgi:hypothetical protein